MPRAEIVRQMFAAVAPRYDLVNRVLSLGIDQGWRRAAARWTGVGQGGRVLDVCAGTGDLACALAARGARVCGSDFTPEMLQLAQRKRVPARATAPFWLAGDTMHLPFRSASFDAATVAFGIRNVADPVQGLREMGRVVRPGGTVVVLEFCKPRLPLVAGLYGLYFRQVVPRLGRWLSGERLGAYSYLPASVAAFPEREAFLQLLRDAGLESPEQRVLTLGIAALYRAAVPR